MAPVNRTGKLSDAFCILFQVESVDCQCEKSITLHEAVASCLTCSLKYNFPFSLILEVAYQVFINQRVLTIFKVEVKKD